MAKIIYPIYNPSIHKCSDMVRVKYGGEFIEAMVLDGIGTVLLNPNTPQSIVMVEKE